MSEDDVERKRISARVCGGGQELGVRGEGVRVEG